MIKNTAKRERRLKRLHTKVRMKKKRQKKLKRTGQRPVLRIRKRVNLRKGKKQWRNQRRVKS
jgi:hypothetical protein